MVDEELFKKLPVSYNRFGFLLRLITRRVRPGVSGE